MVPMLDLWRFATPFEKFLLLLGVIGGLANGLTQPYMTIAFGDVIDGFSGSSVVQSITPSCLTFLIIGIVAFFAATCQVAMFSYVAARQVHRIRMAYLRAIIRQEMAWFDSIQSGELTTRIAGYGAVFCLLLLKWSSTTTSETSSSSKRAWRKSSARPSSSSPCLSPASSSALSASGRWPSSSSLSCPCSASAVPSSVASCLPSPPAARRPTPRLVPLPRR